MEQEPTKLPEATSPTAPTTTTTTTTSTPTPTTTTAEKPAVAARPTPRKRPAWFSSLFTFRFFSEETPKISPQAVVDKLAGDQD